MSIESQIFRLIVASVIGFIIGIERAKRQKSAGVGTFSIICITSCFLTIIAIHGIPDTTDPSRLIANIITAIGFVAGGAIFTVGIGSAVKVTGLTTGAEIFCVAALGIGVGLELYAVVITVVILVEINIFLAMVIKKYYSNRKRNFNILDCNSEESLIGDIEENSLEDDDGYLD